jgi:Ca-activated chloride channel homolog
LRDLVVLRTAIFAIATALLLLAGSAESQTNPQPSQTPATKPNSSRPKQASSTGEEVGSDDVIRVKTTLVTSPVLVIGRDGKYVPTLRREDFYVFEEGIEQTIAYFAEVEKPFTVALLIDVSRSTLFDLRDIQDAAVSFVDQMRHDDRALIVSFDDEITVLAEPTSDRDALRRAIRRTRTGGNSRVYDTVRFVVNQRLDRIEGRKAIILFTDGVDTASHDATYESSLNELQNSDALIYPIQFSTHSYMKEKSARTRRPPPEGTGFSLADYLRADAYLHQAAKQSGTPLYPAYEINDLDHAVASIVDELHNEYSLGYYPRTLGNPGEFRSVDVRVSRPQLFVRARTGYVFDQSGNVTKTPLSERETASQQTALGSLPVHRDFSGDRNPPGARWMCKGPNLSGDLAVVREGFDANCPRSTRPHDETNAWFIRTPRPNEILCKGFFMWNGREVEGAPIPAGYAVIGELVSPACARSNDPKKPANAWSVRLPGQRETVCKGFLIPRGYVIDGETTASNCPQKTAEKNAWLITPKPNVETRGLWREP